MASIGPTLPPHLVKRKRTPDDEASTDSPPAKVRASDKARTNENEVDIESDSDDGYGPPAPKSVSRPPAIGPTLPQKNPDEVALDDQDDRSVGPSAPLPPSTHSPRRSIGPALPLNNIDEVALDSEDEDEDDVGPAPPGPKRVHGPAPPPADLSERPPADSESDSDDDGYGPALPSSTSHQQREARARALEAAEAEAAASQAPKRDDWMLAPPSAGEYRQADPTKLKARRFNSGPRAGGSGGSSEISSIWTETPEEKRKRLENAVLGRDTGAGPTPQGTSAHSRVPTREDAEQAARIQNFTEATRGRSLYEEHQAVRATRRDQQQSKGASKTSSSWAEEEEDDPSKRTFDKEKDMKLGGRIGASQRRELLNKAANFGGRFAKGKYL
ncbi:hypothetical protein F5Y03DRAFT_381016 [Xylaria venustula]|nr:hypothetical protein F5Y03DRAFT_381016 [Xylaria venustula]